MKNKDFFKSVGMNLYTVKISLNQNKNNFLTAETQNFCKNHSFSVLLRNKYVSNGDLVVERLIR